MGAPAVCFSRAERKRLRIIPIDTAESFVEFLRPSAQTWWNNLTERPSHVFRGHADASWKLIPKGWRPLDINPEISSLVRAIAWLTKEIAEPYKLVDQDQAILWRFALAEAAIQFAQLGRSVGLEIPWQIPRSLLISPSNYVPFIDTSLLALAQHHGVPTQLLDWSDDPLTAAFFAIGDEAHADNDLCVWALDVSVVPSGDSLSITLTTEPNIGNSNMRAQSGTFLAYGQGPHLVDLFDRGSWPCFEDNEIISSGLTKITLPGSERRNLQTLLLREKRSRAHLMPSWDAVATTLFDEWTTSSLWSGTPALKRP